jgi:Fic family protein
VSYRPRFTTTDAITAALTRIERARGFLDAAKLSGEWIAGMQARALVLEAHHTTRIEGSTLTLEQSERLMAGQKVPDADRNSARELLNYKRAFEFVSKYLSSGDPITEEMIREIHRRLVGGVRGHAAAPGEYRKVQNYVVNRGTREVIYTPPPPAEVPALMTDLVTWLRGRRSESPVLVAGIAQFQLVHIHPFVDGNGRSARLLSTLCLYRSGYDFKRLFSLSEFYDRDRPAYYRAIQSVRETGMDLTGWLEYFAEGLAVQMDEVKLRGERVIRGDLLARKFKLTERQKGAMELALQSGGLTIRDFEKAYPGATRRTLQRELKKLVELELLVPEGATNRLYYRLGKAK